MTILFICKGNVGRSQMACEFLERLVPDIECRSAGTAVLHQHEGKPIRLKTRKTITCMKEIGFDISNRLMHRLKPDMVSQVDLVISFLPPHELPAFARANDRNFEYWDVPDAGGTNYFTHLIVRDKVRDNIQNLANRLRRVN